MSKVRKATRFTKCALCERLRDAFSQATRDGTPFGELKKKNIAHYDIGFRDCRKYRHKREFLILIPAKYMSIVIDGAEKQDFSLPHFAVSIKDIRGHELKFYIIGLLNHSIINQLHL